MDEQKTIRLITGDSFKVPDTYDIDIVSIESPSINSYLKPNGKRDEYKSGSSFTTTDKFIRLKEKTNNESLPKKIRYYNLRNIISFGDEIDWCP